MTTGDPRHLVRSLSEREKETLRLLLAGHDAKSISLRLSLSVHTVNERLRDARRKLSVSSSREAARLLWQTEGEGPNFFADNQIGVAQQSPGVGRSASSIRRLNTGHPLVWAGGGALIMAIAIIAAALILTSGAAQAPPAKTAAGSQTSTESAQAEAARNWLVLLDGKRWNDSWDLAGAALKSMPKERWASIAQGVRDPLGAVSSRTLQSVTRTNSLPGAPAGEYEVIQFKTSFAQKRDAIETVVLSREELAWKVNGYFIR